MRSTRRAPSTTVAPSAESSRADASPNPLLAPVMATTLPWMLWLMIWLSPGQDGPGHRRPLSSQISEGVSIRAPVVRLTSMRPFSSRLAASSLLAFSMFRRGKGAVLHPITLGERYTLDHELGRGGMAVVYLARDRKHDRPVAIKLLRPEIVTGDDAQRFLLEIQILA